MAITNVVAVAGDSAVFLAWDSGGGDIDIEQVLPASTAAQDLGAVDGHNATGLMNGTSYQWRLREDGGAWVDTPVRVPAPPAARVDVELGSLDPPPVLEPLRYEDVLAAMLADLRARRSDFTALVESDPAVAVLEVAAYRETLLRARVNDAARSLLVATAGGGDLDHLARLVGVVRLAGEADGALRERMRVALGRWTSAGSRAAYEYHARSAHPLVRRAVVRSPVPGAVTVGVQGGLDPEGLPPAEVVAAVRTALDAESVRPLTDDVTVVAVTAVPYTIAATVDLGDTSGADAASVLAAAEAAVRAWAARAAERPGETVHTSAVIAALHVAGVAGVVLAEPAADIDLDPEQVAWPTAATAAEYSNPDTHPMDGITVEAA